MSTTVVPASLIIATRNRHDMLVESVRSVLAGTFVPAEIVIIDQSDQAEHVDMAIDAPQGCAIRHHWTDRRGLSRANNLGVELARNDVIAFTHDDIIADREWLAALVGHLERCGPRTVVTGRVLAGAPEVEGGFAPTLTHESGAATYRGRVGKDVLKPLNMAFHREAARAVGGFDVQLGPGTPFPGAEDADLGFRLLEAGYTIEYLPDAVVYHRAWRSPEDYLPLRWAYGVAQGAFFAKHTRPSDLHMVRRASRNWLLRLGRFPRRVLTEGRRALGDPLFMIGNVVGAVRWCATRPGRRSTPSAE